MIGRVLVIAGSDSGGGAGLQADLKTILALGGYASTAVTTLTVQDTLGVHAAMPVPAEFVVQQAACALADPGADAIKLGMLGNAAVTQAIADLLALHPSLPVVLDPVMVAKGGASLLDAAAVAVLRDRLIPLATVLTPNLPEASALLGHAVVAPGAPARAAMEAAATALLALGAEAVMLKGGHLPGEEVIDVLATAAGVEAFTAQRIATRHTHGTGCTLASAIAIGLAQGLALRDAVVRARLYVLSALAGAPGIGRGHGPLGHGAMIKPFPPA